MASQTVRGLVRLNRRMADLGICSRREADRYIDQACILINGEVATLGAVAFLFTCRVHNRRRASLHLYNFAFPGQKVSENIRKEDIEILPRAQRQQAAKVSFMLHKPRGFISQSSEALRRNQRLAIQLLTPRNRDRACDYKGRNPRSLRKLAVAGTSRIFPFFVSRAFQVTAGLLCECRST